MHMLYRQALSALQYTYLSIRSGAQGRKTLITSEGRAQPTF